MLCNFRRINAYVLSQTLLENLTTGRIYVFLKLRLGIRGYIKVRYIWIPLKKVNVKLVLKIHFKFNLLNSFKHKFDRVYRSSNTFHVSNKCWKGFGQVPIFIKHIGCRTGLGAHFNTKLNNYLQIIPYKRNFHVLGNVVLVIVYVLDLQLPMQSVPITIKVAIWNPTNDEMYSMQHYVIKFFRDLRQGGGFLRIL